MIAKRRAIVSTFQQLSATVVKRRSIARMLMVGLAAAAAFGVKSASAGFIVNYAVAATGQTATADFTFADGDSLVIVLTETTPAATSALTGASAVLTRLGFHLPGGQAAGGTAHISPGGASVGFDGVNPPLGGGADVSTEWGFSPGSQAIGELDGPLPDALRVKGDALLRLSNDTLAQAEEYDALGAAARSFAKTLRDTAAAILSGNPDPQMKKDAEELIKLAEQRERDAANYQVQEDEARMEAGEIRLGRWAMSRDNRRAWPWLTPLVDYPTRIFGRRALRYAGRQSAVAPLDHFREFVASSQNSHLIFAATRIFPQMAGVPASSYEIG